MDAADTSTRGGRKVSEALENCREAISGFGRPQVEQDLVGFGLREVLGLQSRKDGGSNMAMVQAEKVSVRLGKVNLMIGVETAKQATTFHFFLSYHRKHVD